ncbi:MAG: histidine phosphatase family protein [Kofleriaceae bacterium]|nr:histidine phosphatase family protein [Kofleriaceae bacterium]
MQVFMVRHADAVDETLERRDPHRHLTQHGRTQARALGDRLRWHDCVPTHVWTSPLVRAVQTAELALSRIDTDTPIEVVMELAPDGVTREVFTKLRTLTADAVVMLVGHEPSMSALGALLVGKPTFDALGKAHAARIDSGQLRWRFAWDAEAPQTGSRR